MTRSNYFQCVCFNQRVGKSPYPDAIKRWICLRCNLPTVCQHEITVTDADYHIGGWFTTCTQCHEIVASGMLGHN